MLVSYKLSGSSGFFQKNDGNIINILNSGCRQCYMSMKGLARISHLSMSKKIPMLILNSNAEPGKDCFGHQAQKSMQEMFNLYKSTRSLPHFFLHITCQRKNPAP